MLDSMKVLSYPMVLTLMLYGGNVLAESPKLTRDRIYADVAAEAAREGQRLHNAAHEDRLRHRVEAHIPDFATQSQHQYRVQQDKQAQHQHRYQERSSGQHLHQSGIPGRSSGGRMSGGGRRGR